MSDILLRDESITIFFAGHETTARTLAFLLVRPGGNTRRSPHGCTPSSIDGAGDDAPTLAHLKQLPYTLQVVKETLRLYPAAPMYARDVARPRRDRWRRRCRSARR